MSTKQSQISENRPLSAISISSIRKLLPKSMSLTKQQPKLSPLSKPRHIVDDENSPPLDSNIQVPDLRDSLAIPKKSPLKPSNHSFQEPISYLASPDPSVKVVVRIRPPNAHEKGEDWTVRKLSDDALVVGDRNFGFDSVLDSISKQEDVFGLVGMPLVKDALAGYNASILSYGQSGSGKTYTIWGPPSAMVEGHSPSNQQGVGPRIFKMLFSEIERIKADSDGRQINYQCRCSFLEVHNGKLGDLLDPTQRNLEVKDDSKTGFYIENMTEEYVTSYDDVTQILIKGLSNRKVGATNMNAKSSHSHVVFTCVIESWCKETSSNGFSSSRTSRICLVDLAGLNKTKDDSGKELERHGKRVKKSLAELGHLVSILAKGAQPADKVYRHSHLTHLLQESLGGNAKLSVICNISPSNGDMGETLSTVRFAQKVRCVKNFPMINQITEDDVNDLSDQIRQLKEDLLKAKLDADNPTKTSNASLFKGSVRESVNRLRLSLNRSLILTHIEKDHEKVSANEVDVEALCKQLDDLHQSCDGHMGDLPCFSDSMNFASARESCDTYFSSDHESNCLHDSENEDANSCEAEQFLEPLTGVHESSVLEDPALSDSPKISNSLRKSTSPSILSRNQNAVASVNNSKTDFDVTEDSVQQSEKAASSLRSSRIVSSPTESLAASLRRGLEIIDYHQRNSVSRSSVAFSFEHLMLKPSPAADNVHASVQIISSGQPYIDGIMCTSCRRKVQDSDETYMVEGDGNKKKELENVCNEQAAKIEELTCLVEKLKQEKDSFAVSKEDPEDIDQDLDPEVVKEACEIKEFAEASKEPKMSFDLKEKEELLQEIETLKFKLEGYTKPIPNKSIDMLRSSLLSRSFQLRKSTCVGENPAEELEKERERWTEMESEWINLTDELRIDLECNRQRAERVEMDLSKEKKCNEEIEDALHRAVLGHARFIEHYVELQEKYDDLAEKHRRIAEYIADVKRAAEKAGAKGKKGSHFSRALAAELSNSRMEKEKERERLKKENRSLKIQLRDTAEAVHTAGELLVRLREAEQSASVAETTLNGVQHENEKLRRQVDKVKRKHKMEVETMKQYMAGSKLPQSALHPTPCFDQDSEISPFEEIEHYDDHHNNDDDQAWRAEFGAIYQDQDQFY